MKADSADNGSIALRPAIEKRRADRREGRERGQALVEFALVAPLFVALVAGVVQFGVALNFWLDLQRLANQGARSAAVNCGPAAANQCGPEPTLEASLEKLAISKGNNPNAEICFESMTGTGPSGPEATVGDAVRVTLRTTYQFVPIVRVATVKLKASATMRLEQKPDNPGLAGTGACPP